MENLKNFEHLHHFFGLCCHKIIPLIYDNSLSYYEVLCRLRYKINEIVDTINGLIDADIEGYLKDLIDTYATEEVTKLINEIGEDMLNEIAERVITEKVTEWESRLAQAESDIDDLENVDKEIVPRVMSSGQKEVVFNREHYIWFGDPGQTSGTPGTGYLDSNGDGFHKCDVCLVDDDYYYYLVSSANFLKIFKVDRDSYQVTFSPEFTLDALGKHGAVGRDQNGVEYLVFYKSNQMQFMDPNTFTIVKTLTQNPSQSVTPGQDYIGRIGYDPVDNEWWGSGAMQSKNNYTIYKIVPDWDNNSYTVDPLFSYVNDIILSIPQNMSAYDGLIYMGCSNPNCIVVIDPELEKIVNIIHVNDRLDYIIPLAELQSAQMWNGKLYVSGYNSITMSGCRYLNVIGSCDVDHGVFLSNQSVLRTTDDIPNHVIYVSRNSTEIAAASPGSIHGLKYDRFKNAIGWSGDYDYLPFYNLWESVECAVGLFNLTGIKSTIRLGDDTLYGETNVPGWCVNEISCYDPRVPSNQRNIYGRVRYLRVYGGGTMTIRRVGITGARHVFIDPSFDPSGTNFADTGALLCEGTKIHLENCAILRGVGGGQLSNGRYYDFMRTVQGGEIYFGQMAAYSNWGLTQQEWPGNIPSGTRFAYANTGLINYAVNSAYLDTSTVPIRKTDLAFLNFVQP